MYEVDKRYQTDATIGMYYKKIISTGFGHLYAHLQECGLYVATYGVEH
jgi:hypothetical protein